MYRLGATKMMITTPVDIKEKQPDEIIKLSIEAVSMGFEPAICNYYGTR
jgi:hypothetical protein